MRRIALFFTAWLALSTLTLGALVGAHVAVPWMILWAALFPLDLAWRRYWTRRIEQEASSS